MSLRDQLQGIYDVQRSITPPMVVDAARPADHPLHEHFEWDDAIAGEAHRRAQAAEMIRSVKIVVSTSADGEPFSVRVYHSVPEPTGTVYKSVQDIAEDPFTRQLVERAAEREWLALKRKYGHLTVFFDMVRRDVA